MPAMNEAIAKLTTFTKTTLTPIPAAERSLARTASIADPSALVRSRATPKATTTQTIRHMKPKDRRGKSLPIPTPRSSPKSFGCRDRVAERVDELGVAEPDRLDAERERQCDDPERQAAQAEGWEADEDADDRRGESRRGAERSGTARPSRRSGSSA